MQVVEEHDWSLARRRWGIGFAVAMAVLAALSAVRLTSSPWSFRLEVSTTTALFVALAVVPWLLERLVDRGGSLRLPGGVEVALDAKEVREVGLPGLSATRMVVDARLGRLEQEYERRRGTAATWERTQHLERILAEARLLAGAASEHTGDRLTEFEDASDGQRAVTVALLEGAVAVPGASAATLVSGLAAPRSSFEEYHLLTALRLHHRYFTRDEVQSLRALVERRLEEGAWPAGSDRRGLARRVRAEMSG